MMMRNEIINSKRISINEYFHNDELINYRGDAHMFIEDLRLGILSYSDKDKMDVKLYPENPEFEKLLINSFQVSNTYRGRNNILIDFIAELIDEIANHISYFGFAIYEIIKYDREIIKSGKKEYHREFYIDSIRNIYNLEIRKNYILQNIPNELQEKGHPKNIKIPKDNCIIFSFPDELGGYKKHLETFKYLNADSGFNAIKDLSLYNMTGKLNEYSFSKHLEILDYSSWKATSYINWHHRKYNDEKCGLQHYRYARALKFLKSQIIIREKIISDLNKAIKKLSKEYVNTEIEIKIEGLTTIKDINEAITKWYDGKMGFDEINNFY